jgi:hypothetical protein
MTTISRRGVLAGIGATTGAVAFGTLAGTAGAQSDGSGGFGTSGTLEPQLSTAVLPPQQPGLTYIPIDPTAFFVYDETTNGRVVSATSGTTVVTAGLGVMAPILVPVGSRIKEVTLTYISPAGAATLNLYKKPLLSSYLRAPSAPNAVPLPNGAGVLTTTLAVDELVDGTASYMVLMDLMTTTQFVNGVLVGYLPPPQSFISLPAILRVLDTRTTGGKLQPNEERVVDLQLPPFARAGVINLTVTETEVAGFVAVFPANVPYPGNSSINWAASNQNIANGVITGLDTTGTTGKVKIRGGVNPTHVVIDVQGYLI